MKNILITLSILLPTLLLGQEITSLNGIPGGDIDRMQEGPNGQLYVLEENSKKVYRSSDKGDSWVVLPSILEADLFFAGSNVFLYGINGILYQSLDNGATWERTNDFLYEFLIGEIRIYESVVSPGTLILMGQGTVLVSTDLGLTWLSIFDNEFPRSIWGKVPLTQTADGDLYWATDDGLFRHKFPTDGVWDKINSELVENNTTSVAYASTSDRLFINYYDQNENVLKMLYSETGDAGSWLPFPMLPEFEQNQVQLLSITGTIYMLFGESLWELTDEQAGVWVQKNSPAFTFGRMLDMGFYRETEGSIFALSRGVNSDDQVLTYGWGVFRSDDDGQSWVMANGTGNLTISYGNSYDIEVLENGNFVVVPSAQSKGLFVSNDQGFSFDFVSIGATVNNPFARSYPLIKLDDNSVIIPTDQGIAKSTDGLNWSVSGIDYSDFSFFYSGSTLFRMRNNWYTFSPAPSIFVSNDEGTTWQENPLSGLPASGSFMFATIHNGDIFLAIRTDIGIELYQIDSSSGTWATTLLTIPSSFIESTFRRRFSNLFSSQGKLYMGNKEEVAYSSDNGQSWSIFNLPHNYLFPIDQKGAQPTDPVIRGIGMASDGILTVTQNDGDRYSNFSLEDPYGSVNHFTQMPNGTFLFTSNGGPIGQFSSKLLLNQSEFPNPIVVNWEPLEGPFVGEAKILKSEDGNIFAVGTNTIYKYDAVNNIWIKIVNSENDVLFPIIKDNTLFYQTPYENSFGQILTKLTGIDVDGNVVLSSTKWGGGGVEIANNGNIIWGLDVSVDNGLTWQNMGIYSGDRQYFRSVSKIVKLADGTLIASGVEIIDGVETFNLFRSQDNGISWSVLDNVTLLQNERINDLYLLEDNALIYSKSVSGEFNADIYRSEDNGASWQKLPNRDYFITNSIFNGPNGDYYMLNSNELLVSTDKGQSWTLVKNTNDLMPDENLNLVNIVYSGDQFILGTTTGIYSSTNDFSSTENISYGFTSLFDLIYQPLAMGGTISAFEDKILLNHFDSRSFISEDDGTSFQESIERESILRLQNGVIVSTGFGISISDENGENFTTYYELEKYFLKIYTADENVFYSLIQNQDDTRYIAISDNLIDWTEIDLGTFENVLVDFVVDKNGSIFFVDNGGFLYRSTFGFNEKLDFGVIKNLEFANDKIVIRTEDQRILSSSDGFLWENVIAPPLSEFVVTENGYFFMAGYNSMYISRDGGKVWETLDPILNSVVDLSINLSNGKAYAISPGNPTLRSNIVLLLDNETVPQFETFTPANNAENIAVENPTFSINFSEAVNPVPGRTLRIFKTSSPAVPVAIINADSGVMSNDNSTVTYSTDITLDNLTSYFVVIERGSFIDLYGNITDWLTDPTAWTFTTIDGTPPEIQLISQNLDLIKGSERVFNISVTDNKEIDATNTFLYARRITSEGTQTFRVENMTATGVTSTSANYSIIANPIWYDAIGLEFYFESADAAGNISRLPGGEDSYFYSYINHINEKPSFNISPGESQGSYRIISVPFKLDNSDIATQIDELGEYSNENFRMFGHTSGNTYDEYPAALTTFERGKGYWIISRNSANILLDGATSPSNNRKQFFTMSLKQGWNLIGNPYPVPISWEETRQADLNNIRGVKTYANGYNNGNVLAPFTGGFVFAETDIPALKVRFQGILTGGRITDIKSSLLDESQWFVPMVIRDGDIANRVAGVGMHSDASEEKDRFDDYNPPPINGKLQISFPIEGSDFGKNIVKKQEEYIWNMSAISESGSALIEWDRNALGNNRYNLYLIDQQTLEIIDMRQIDNFSMGGSKEKAFSIYYGTKSLDQMALASTYVGDIWPNPINNEFHIPVSISTNSGAANVTLRFFDTMGNLISDGDSYSLNSGLHTLNKDISSSDMKPGIYFLRIEINGNDGSYTGETKKILIK